MRWMLDTNTLVYALNARPQHQQVLDRFNDHDSRTLCVSAITLAELRFGVEKSAVRDRNDRALDAFVLPLEVADFDEAAAAAYGAVRSALEKAGTPVGPLDTQIGAHALSLGAALVTHNVREFRRVPGLTVVDWL